VKPLSYVDADTLGLAHVLIRARPDVTFPGDDGERHKKSWRLPLWVITDPASHDDVWIPAVARAGMAIITRDKHIAMRTAEINEVIRSGARMFAITSSDQLTIWDQLTIVVEQWQQLERAAAEEGPYIYSVTRTAMSESTLKQPDMGR